MLHKKIFVQFHMFAYNFHTALILYKRFIFQGKTERRMVLYNDLNP